MESSTETVWTDEKHLHFLNTMEASFVNTMLHHYAVVSTTHHSLRLDRYLPDTSESTLDSKPNRRLKKHKPSDSMGPRGKRRKRKSPNQLHNNSSSTEEQVVAQLENGRESVACIVEPDHKEPTTYV